MANSLDTKIKKQWPKLDMPVAFAKKDTSSRPFGVTVSQTAPTCAPQRYCPKVNGLALRRDSFQIG
jgi:hypothetical protein